MYRVSLWAMLPACIKDPFWLGHTHQACHMQSTPTWNFNYFTILRTQGKYQSNLLSLVKRRAAHAICMCNP